MNVKLKEDLADASQQLVARGNELTKSKAELVSHRQEIDVSKLFFFSCSFGSLNQFLKKCHIFYNQNYL